MGQLPQSGHVADGPQPFGRAQVCVDGHAVSVGLDAHRLKSDVSHARAPAGRNQQPFPAQLPATVEFEYVILAVAPCAGHVR